MQTFVDGWVADDAVACCNQSIFDGVDPAARNTKSLVLKPIDREFFLRKVRLQHLAEDRLVVGGGLLLTVRFLTYDAFNLGGDFLARSED